MDFYARLHGGLNDFLRQHCPVCDERHLALLGWMAAGLLLSQTICFGHWQRTLPLQHCLAASRQRRCRRWLSNQCIGVEALYGPLVLWAVQQQVPLELSQRLIGLDPEHWPEEPGSEESAASFPGPRITGTEAPSTELPIASGTK